MTSLKTSVEASIQQRNEVGSGIGVGVCELGYAFKHGLRLLYICLLVFVLFFDLLYQECDPAAIHLRKLDRQKGRATLASLGSLGSQERISVLQRGLAH